MDNQGATLFTFRFVFKRSGSKTFYLIKPFTSFYNYYGIGQPDLEALNGALCGGQFSSFHPNWLVYFQGALIAM